ncbi:tetratricopeptide repeat protein [Massilia sp. W12]|uniref:SirB1 family protein n=1 Tax=Massilia sp. W12 TaxID=3126507 RepID=UPI0030D1208D
MNLNPAPLDKLDYFAALVREDRNLALFEAALSLAQDAEEPIDLAATLAEFDQLANRLQQRLPSDASRLQKLHCLLRFFYHDLGFAANLNDFYHPDNSYLHRVMATRRGIPISLAVLFLEFAQHISLPVQGVSFPGHFLMKLDLPSGEVVLDPLTGQSLGREQLEHLLLNTLDMPQGDLSLNEIPSDELKRHLQACNGRQILIRMLQNLKLIFLEHEDWPKLLNVLQRLLILQPDDLLTRRDRGFTWAQLECPQAAVQDLQDYVEQRPHGLDAELINAMLPELRQAAARFN